MATARNQNCSSFLFEKLNPPAYITPYNKDRRHETKNIKPTTLPLQVDVEFYSPVMALLLVLPSSSSSCWTGGLGHAEWYAVKEGKRKKGYRVLVSREATLIYILGFLSLYKSTSF